MYVELRIYYSCLWGHKCSFFSGTVLKLLCVYTPMTVYEDGLHISTSLQEKNEVKIPLTLALPSSWCHLEQKSEQSVLYWCCSYSFFFLNIKNSLKPKSDLWCNQTPVGAKDVLVHFWIVSGVQFLSITVVCMFTAIWLLTHSLVSLSHSYRMNTWKKTSKLKSRLGTNLTWENRTM